MLKKILLSSTLALAALVGVAVSQSVIYYGYDPSTGLDGQRGLPVNYGVAPALSGCATLSAKTGGAGGGSFVTSGTSCNLVITYTIAAANTKLNGLRCSVRDLTTPADTVSQTATAVSSTVATATFAGTTVAADKLLWGCEGF